MLIPILVSVFVAISFNRLAESYSKSKAQYATFGVLWFLFGSFGFAFLLGLLSTILPFDVTQMNQFLLSIILYLLGGLIVIIYYNFLKKKWNNEKENGNKELLDDVLID